ncbi:MAG: hypothetical protein EOP19_16160, partial [Hyphomicrobiales bacterium]
MYFRNKLGKVGDAQCIVSDIGRYNVRAQPDQFMVRGGYPTHKRCVRSGLHSQSRACPCLFVWTAASVPAARLVLRPGGVSGLGTLERDVSVRRRRSTVTCPLCVVGFFLYLVKTSPSIVYPFRLLRVYGLMGVTPILELLGIPQLRVPDGTTVELRQKAFALAALLHIEYRGRARRQAVSDRLWETASGAQASTNLRQVLLNTRGHESRHGFKLFHADATYVALNASVRLDLAEIQRIRGVTEPREFLRLLGLYRAGLLEGLTGSAEELERWIETERTRIENQFVAAATATALRIGGSVAEAALARLAEIQPYSDQVCQAQMRLAHEAGDEHAVGSIYADFRSRLWTALSVEPEPETSALLNPPLIVPAIVGKTMPQADAGPTFPAEIARVPRIVLLPPLQEFGRSATPRHLAPALIEDVTISLCRLRSLTVIAPHSAWQFDPFSAIDE